jgi:hypothetical protein
MGKALNEEHFRGQIVSDSEEELLPVKREGTIEQTEEEAKKIKVKKLANMSKIRMVSSEDEG